MRFTYPWLLYATPVLTAVLWLALRWAEQRRTALRSQFTGSGDRPWADPGFIPGRQRWELGLTLAAFALLLITLSEPRRFKPAEKSEMQGLPYLFGCQLTKASQLFSPRQGTGLAVAGSTGDMRSDTAMLWP